MPVENSTDDIKNDLAGEKEEEIQVIRYIKGGKAIPLVELVFQKECTFNKNLQNEITLEKCTSRWTQNVPPNGLFNVSTVNNAVVMYPKL